jgi:hypothetical protein
MNELQQMLAQRIASGLKRKAVDKCSKWACLYRVMGQPFPGLWNWDHHPWLYEMHDADAERLVGQKAAQMGFTEWALNKAFYSMDILGISVLYILPSDDDASDFSAARFDKALENSPHLQSFFSQVKNVGHKRAGNSSLYVRGSRSRSKLKSIDTALIVFDEMDEMHQANITLAQERQSGQRAETQQILEISTPTIEGFGINRDFNLSTQEHFMFKCPKCKKHTELTFPESIVITAESELDPKIKETHYICTLCKGKLEHELKHEYLKPKDFGGTAHFVATHSDRDWRGFYVPQMYSFTVTPAKFAAGYLRGKNDPTEETEFFNSKVGVPHAVEGSKITSEQIDACTWTFLKGNRPKNSIRTMGVDVGSVLHCVIEEWELLAQPHPGMQIGDYAVPYCLFEGTTSGIATDFDELDRFMREWLIDGCVIDSEPERRLAYQFATRHYGKVLLCDWLYSQQGRQVVIGPEEECSIKANRTSWLDMSFARFKNKTIRLPNDRSAMYVKQIKEPQRVYKKDRYGNQFAVYESLNADHFAFARVYSEIAFPLASAVATNQNVTGMY